MTRPSFSFRVPDLPNEVRFNIFKHLDTPEDWKNYSEVYPHIATDDYFWKKLIIQFPELTIETCRDMEWNMALQRVDFNFTLIHAYETDDIRLARRVLDYGGNKYQYYEDIWLFFKIILENKFDMALLFLNKGFNINAVMPSNFQTQTVLTYCVRNNNIEGVKFSLEHGADVNVVVGNINYMFSALATFCSKYFEYQNDDMLHLLTDYGADYNLKNTKKNYVALHILIFGLRGYILTRQFTVVEVSAVKRMFTLFVLKTDMTIVDSFNRTFLHWLCKIYDNNIINDELFKFIITLFLNAGIFINTVDGMGKTACDYAFELDDNPICEFLKQRGGLYRDEIEID